MKVVHGVDSLDRSLGSLLVVIGVFDGLHRGHLYLLEQLEAAAAARAAQPAVITFDHHPDEVITGAAPPLLCDPDERLRRLDAAGVAVTVVQTFDVALRMTPFDQFVGRIAGRVDLAGFLMTPESAFGHDRGGTPDTVGALGRELGFDVVVVPQFELDGRPVRSTDVRAAIAAGNLAEAQRLLGRRYAIGGTVSRARREATDVTWPLPVALPPPGRYESRVVTPGGAVRLRDATLDGTVAAIEPPVPAVVGQPLAIELVRARPS
jgi:riboflavin kinase / FMN adenylyltransferase